MSGNLNINSNLKFINKLQPYHLVSGLHIYPYLLHSNEPLEAYDAIPDEIIDWDKPAFLRHYLAHYLSKYVQTPELLHAMVRYQALVLNNPELAINDEPLRKTLVEKLQAWPTHQTTRHRVDLYLALLQAPKAP